MASNKKTTDIVWVVVVVKGGFPTFVEVYRDEETAKQRVQFYHKDLREAYDEVGVFEVKIGSEASI